MAVSQRCIKTHLRTELDYWEPEKIAVFSATARDALQELGILFDGYIAHPTARGLNMNREHRRKELERLKFELDFGDVPNISSEPFTGQPQVLKPERTLLDRKQHNNLKRTSTLKGNHVMGKIVREIPTAYRPSEAFRDVSKLYREFRNDGIELDPNAKIRRTDTPIIDVLRILKGHRFNIFSDMKTGMTVEEVCIMAKKHHGTHQHDVFHALAKKYITLQE